MFDSCEKRQDKIGMKIKSQILDGIICLTYHRDCRSTYTSSTHINGYLKGQNEPKRLVDGGDVESSGGGGSVFTRSKSTTPILDWKSKCFICTQLCNLK